MKWVRRLGVALALIVLLIAILAVVAGGMLRGSMLSFVANRISHRLCGSIEVGGGAFDMLFVPKILMQRSFAIRLNDLVVRDPDGEEVFFAQRIALRLQYRRNLRTLVISETRIDQGRWHMVSTGPGQPVGFLRAFRPLRNEPEMCMEPAAVMPPTPRRPGIGVRVEPTQLHNLDVFFSFHSWSLSLARTNAHGTLRLVDDGGQPHVLFDVTNVRASDSRLRIGPKSVQSIPALVFDRVQIDQVAVDPFHPYDIQLKVQAARSAHDADAVLTGQATFVNALAPFDSLRWELQGLQLDAHFDNFGRILPAVVHDTGLIQHTIAPIPADLTVKLKGLYTALLGTVRLTGPHLQLLTTLQEQQRMALTGSFERFALSPHLPAALRPVLGGRLTGHLQTALHAAPLPALKVGVESLSLRLDRQNRNQWPMRVHLRGPGAKPARAGPEDLVIDFDRAGIEKGVFLLTGFDVNGPGLSLRNGRAAWGVAPPTDQPLKPGDLHVSVAKVMADFGRLLPRSMVKGRVVFSADARGSPDRLQTRLNFTPRSRLQVAGQPVGLPQTVTAIYGPRRAIRIDRFRIELIPGGFFTVWGQRQSDGQLDAGLWVRRFSLATLGRLTHARIAPEHRSALEWLSSLRGRLMASLRVRGTQAAPRISGQLALSDVRIRGARLGNGGLVVRSTGPGRVRVRGRLVQSLGVDARARLGDQAALDADLNFDRLAIGTLLPKHMQALRDVTMSGTGRMNLNAQHQHASANGLLAGRAGRMAVDAHLQERVVNASLSGRMAVAPIISTISERLKARGRIGTDIKLRWPMDWRDGEASPTIEGEIATTSAITLRAAVLSLPIVIAPGARVRLHDQRLTVHHLNVQGAGSGVAVNGQAMVDWQQPVQSRLAFNVTGRLQGHTVAALTNSVAGAATAVDQIRGDITLDSTVRGTIHSPRVKGTATFNDLTIVANTLAPVRGATIHGVIGINNGTLFTSRFEIATGSGSQIILGGRQPAHLTIARLRPFDIGVLMIPIRILNLKTVQPMGPIQLDNLDADLQLRSISHNDFLLTGRILVNRGSLSVRNLRKTPAEKASPPIAERVHLDVRIISDGGFKIQVPVIPDLKLGFHCRIRGKLSQLGTQGRLGGGGAYSNLVLFVYDLFTSRHLRACDLTKG